MTGPIHTNSLHKKCIEWLCDRIVDSPSLHPLRLGATAMASAGTGMSSGIVEWDGRKGRIVEWDGRKGSYSVMTTLPILHQRCCKGIPKLLRTTSVANRGFAKSRALPHCDIEGCAPAGYERAVPTFDVQAHVDDGKLALYA